MTERVSDRLFTRRQALAIGGGALGAGVFGRAVLAQDSASATQDAYRVTIANNTRGQPLTPPAVVAHLSSVEVFAVGDPATEPVRQLAENGNLEPLVGLVGNTSEIRGSVVGSTPLVPESDPGNTGNPYYTTLTLTADSVADYMTFVSMLIGTNDGIVGLDTVPLPEDYNESRTYYANGYDVGTEQNTEMFADLVPPAKTLILGGEPEGTTESDPSIAEDDVIRPHAGIQGVGNLPPSVYDWSEPAALVQVERIEAETTTPTDTPTATPTETPPGTGTPTETPPGTGTPTETPPGTGTPTETPPGTGTPTETPPGTGTPTETPPGTGTPTETPPGTGTPTETPPGTGTPTETPPGTGTPTETPSETDTPTDTDTEG